MFTEIYGMLLLERDLSKREGGNDAVAVFQAVT